MSDYGGNAEAIGRGKRKEQPTGGMPHVSGTTESHAGEIGMICADNVPSR